MLPHEFLLQAFPPLPVPSADHPIAELAPPSSSETPFTFKFETQDTWDKTREFTAGLVAAHRKRIVVTEHQPPQWSTVHEWLGNIMLPRIAHLFSQLQRDHILNDPAKRQDALQAVRVSTNILKDGSSISSFNCEGLGLSPDDIKSPIIICCSRSLYQTISNPSQNTAIISSFLRHAWLQRSRQRPIICTDMVKLTVFQQHGWETDVVSHGTTDMQGNPLCLCVLIAAFLYDGLRRSSFPIYLPYGLDDDPEHGTVRGWCTDPKAPLLPDEAVFETHRRHEDFEFCDVDHALQFLRWKCHIRDSTSPIFAKVGDVLEVETHGFFEMNTPLSPYYGVDELPQDTSDHIDSCQRPPSPLADQILASSSFSLELVEDLTTRSGAVMCRAYRCVVRSVDGTEACAADSTSFCVKLFDDRFLTFPADDVKDILAEYGFHAGSEDVLEDAEDGVGGVSAETEVEHVDEAAESGSWDVEAAMWSMIDRYWETAEQCVRREDAVYTKLDFMQGSLIPRYFGAHTFTLADGHDVPGILMEYIPSQSLRNGVGRDLDTEQQIQLIKSVRHAVRVLQYADVSQHDWHPGQILCHHSEDGSVHGVLIDFAQTRQSFRELELRMDCDATDAFRILLDKRTGLDEELVWAHFDPPEIWDSGGALITNGQVYGTDSPFKFIYDALNASAP